MSKRQKQLSRAHLRMNRMSRHGLANFYSRLKEVRQSVNFSQEWNQLCSDLGVSQEKSKIVCEILRHQYMQPHGHYHNIGHIEDCLSLLRVCYVGGSLSDYRMLRFALFMHDAVYDTWSQGNEERSVDFANFCAGRLDFAVSPFEPNGFMEQVRSCILSTKHSELVDDYCDQLCADIDLFGMSLDWDTFIANERKVRQEYFWTTEEEFIEGNSKIMKWFLERGQIYQTKWFYENFENLARANIGRLLKGRGF